MRCFRRPIPLTIKIQSISGIQVNTNLLYYIRNIPLCQFNFIMFAINDMKAAILAIYDKHIIQKCKAFVDSEQTAMKVLHSVCAKSI